MEFKNENGKDSFLIFAIENYSQFKNEFDNFKKSIQEQKQQEQEQKQQEQEQKQKDDIELNVQRLHQELNKDIEIFNEQVKCHNEQKSKLTKKSSTETKVFVREFGLNLYAKYHRINDDFLVLCKLVHEKGTTSTEIRKFIYDFDPHEMLLCIN